MSQSVKNIYTITLTFLADELGLEGGLRELFRQINKGSDVLRQTICRETGHQPQDAERAASWRKAGWCVAVKLEGPKPQLKLFRPDPSTELQVRGVEVVEVHDEQAYLQGIYQALDYLAGLAVLIQRWKHDIREPSGLVDVRTDAALAVQLDLLTGGRYTAWYAQAVQAVAGQALEEARVPQTSPLPARREDVALVGPRIRRVMAAAAAN